MILGASLLQKRLDEGRERIHAIDGSDVLKPSHAADLNHARPLSLGEIDEGHLRSLEGQVVTLSAPQAVNMMVPVDRWQERATGKKMPTHPPTYFVLQSPASNPSGGFPGGPPPGMTISGMLNPSGGPALTIIPGEYIPVGQRVTSNFTGVIRPLQNTDRRPIEGLLRSRGVQTPPLPYVLDCLNVGEMRGAPWQLAPASPGSLIRIPMTFWLPMLMLVGLSTWNLVKAVSRLKNPSLHPVYSQLAQYGPVAAVERSIDADIKRGSRRLPPVEITSHWLLASSFFGVNVVPLDWIVWIARPRRIRLGRTMILTYIRASMTLLYMDRMGKQHTIYGRDGQMDAILSLVSQGRSWMEVGWPSALRDRFGADKAGFIAAVEARRQAMTGLPTPPPIP